MWWKKNSREIINTIILTLLFLVMGLIIVLFYWVVIDNNNPPVKMEVLPYNHQMIQNEVFQFPLKIDRMRACPIVIDRTIRNVFTNEVKNVGSTEGVIYEKEIVSRIVHVDKSQFLLPGVYSYEMTFSYYCNPANKIFGPIRYGPVKIYFEVIPASVPIDKNDSFDSRM